MIDKTLILPCRNPTAINGAPKHTNKISPPRDVSSRKPGVTVVAGTSSVVCDRAVRKPQAPQRLKRESRSGCERRPSP